MNSFVKREYAWSLISGIAAPDKAGPKGVDKKTSIMEVDMINKNGPKAYSLFIFLSSPRLLRQPMLNGLNASSQPLGNRKKNPT